MTYMITAECINCGACEMDCPVRAIAPAASQYVIDASVCMECAGYFDIPRCTYACPVNACVPARETYLFKAAALARRGAEPLILKPGLSPAGATIANMDAAQQRLAALQKKLDIVSNKETRAEIKYEIARLQWQLGLISDDAFHAVENFYENFTYEWC